jgi:hypothetical protein
MIIIRCHLSVVEKTLQVQALSLLRGESVNKTTFMALRTKLVCLSYFYIRRTRTFSIYVYHISVLSYLASIDHVLIINVQLNKICSPSLLI